LCGNEAVLLKPEKFNGLYLTAFLCAALHRAAAFSGMVPDLNLPHLLIVDKVILKGIC
jgi:hypothetical protein